MKLLLNKLFILTLCSYLIVGCVTTKSASKSDSESAEAEYEKKRPSLGLDNAFTVIAGAAFFYLLVVVLPEAVSDEDEN